MSFYLTHCEPGEAQGAGELTHWSDYGCMDEFDEENWDEEYVDDDIRWPLDHYFPRT